MLNGLVGQGKPVPYSGPEGRASGQRIPLVKCSPSPPAQVRDIHRLLHSLRLTPTGPRRHGMRRRLARQQPVPHRDAPILVSPATGVNRTFRLLRSRRAPLASDARARAAVMCCWCSTGARAAQISEGGAPAHSGAPPIGVMVLGWVMSQTTIISAEPPRLETRLATNHPHQPPCCSSWCRLGTCICAARYHPRRHRGADS